MNRRITADELRPHIPPEGISIAALVLATGRGDSKLRSAIKRMAQSAELFYLQVSHKTRLVFRSHEDWQAAYNALAADASVTVKASSAAPFSKAANVDESRAKFTRLPSAWDHAPPPPRDAVLPVRPGSLDFRKHQRRTA